METEVLIQNPFPGLRAFDVEEDVLFFGREKQIDELLRKLRTSRFLAIIGSSGSGKSSLVRSGLLPSLHSGLMSGVGSQWRIALFKPGNDPIGQLNLALTKNGVLRDDQSEEDLQINTAINETILRRSNLGLIEAYKQSGLDKRNNLLVLVDQFEEIFRFSKYEKESGEGKRDSVAFINLLLKAAEQTEVPIYVVFTMRSDFLGDCTEFRGLPEAINEGQYLVPRMTRDERREAITGPIAVGGATITPALVNRLLNDVGDNPDQLPIMQHALMRTWAMWKSKSRPDQPIDIEDYEQIGTISDALSQHAEEAYAELNGDRERTICGVIFKELTDKGGLASGVRRPRMLSELCAAAAASHDEVVEVINVFRKLGRGFLMPPFPTPLTDKTIIDISHESIMRVWKRLITWLEEEDESTQVYLHLCEAVNLYETGKGSLLRDPELQIALKWREEQNKNAAWASRYNNYFDKVIFFLEHSRRQRDLEIKHKEELQKHRLRNSRRITIAVSLVALLALIGGVYTYYLKLGAERDRKEAETQKKSAETERQKAERSRVAAVAADSLAEGARKDAETKAAEARQAEINALKSDSVARKEATHARQEAFAAQAAKKESDMNAERARQNADEAKRNADEANRARLQAYNEKEATKKAQQREQSKNDANRAKMYMNDTADYRKGLNLSLEAYAKNQENGGNFQDDDIYSALYISWKYALNDKNRFSAEAPVRALAGIPGSNVVFAGDESGHISVAREHNGILEVAGSKTRTNRDIRSLAVSPDGGWLLAVSLNAATLFKINGDMSLQKAGDIPFAGKGKHGAFLNNQYLVVQTGNALTRYQFGTKLQRMDSLGIPGGSGMAVAGNGHLFVTADRSVYEYTAWDAKPTLLFNASSAITSIALDKSGRYLATGTYNGGVMLKELTSNEHPISYSGVHKSAVNDVKFGTVANGRLQLATASSDKTVKLLEVTGDGLNTRDLITVSPDHTNWVYSLVYSNDGRMLYSAGEDRRVIARPTTMKYLYDALTAHK